MTTAWYCTTLPSPSKIMNSVPGLSYWELRNLILGELKNFSLGLYCKVMSPAVITQAHTLITDLHSTHILHHTHTTQPHAIVRRGRDRQKNIMHLQIPYSLHMLHPLTHTISSKHKIFTHIHNSHTIHSSLTYILYIHAIALIKK